jgi:hypothetical protein
MTSQPQWPQLKLDDWASTRETLHMWLQILGKIELESTVLVNHWWNAALQVSARGLRTGLMNGGDRRFDAEFDFIDHQLVFRSTDGASSSVALTSRSVADFYNATTQALSELEFHVKISATPNEVDPAIPFAQDETHRQFDPSAAETFWRQLVAADQVFQTWRARFGGKSSPVQVFWGSMDLSCVRYSGRSAPQWNGEPPPACPKWVLQEAESRECASAGFWPGGSEEGSFYAYASPSPKGYTDASLSVGRFDTTIGEWILDYADVRQSEDPAATLMSFLEETYGLAADLAHWDRSLLDIDPGRFDQERRHSQ